MRRLPEAAGHPRGSPTSYHLHRNSACLSMRAFLIWIIAASSTGVFPSHATPTFQSSPHTLDTLSSYSLLPPSWSPSVLQDRTAPDRPGTESLPRSCLSPLFLVRAEMERKVENSLCLPLQTNPGARAGSGEGERVSYRLRVIKALVQRYIETARREFEETRRKGQWFTCNAPPLLLLAHLEGVPTPSLTLHTPALGSSPILSALESLPIWLLDSVTLYLLFHSHSLIYMSSDTDLTFSPFPLPFPSSCLSKLPRLVLSSL